MNEPLIKKLEAAACELERDGYQVVTCVTDGGETFTTVYGDKGFIPPPAILTHFFLIPRSAWGHL